MSLPSVKANPLLALSAKINLYLPTLGVAVPITISNLSVTSSSIPFITLISSTVVLLIKTPEALYGSKNDVIASPGPLLSGKSQERF